MPEPNDAAAVRGSSGIPEAFDGAPIAAALGMQPETPLAAGVRQTVECYRAALNDGKIRGADLDRILA